jgi:hypothetical protein
MMQFAALPTSPSPSPSLARWVSPASPGYGVDRQPVTMLKRSVWLAARGGGRRGRVSRSLSGAVICVNTPSAMGRRTPSRLSRAVLPAHRHGDDLRRPARAAQHRHPRSRAEGLQRHSGAQDHLPAEREPVAACSTTPSSAAARSSGPQGHRICGTSADPPGRRSSFDGHRADGHRPGTIDWAAATM